MLTGMLEVPNSKAKRWCEAEKSFQDKGWRKGECI